MHTSKTRLAVQIPLEFIAFSDTMICKTNIEGSYLKYKQHWSLKQFHDYTTQFNVQLHTIATNHAFSTDTTERCQWSLAEERNLQTHFRFVCPSNQSSCVLFLFRHALTGISRCWGQCHHEGLQLQMGLLPGLLGGGLQHLLLPAPGVVREELPRAVRGSGKSHSGGGETDQLEEGGSCSHQPAPPSPCRCFALFHTGPLQIKSFIWFAELMGFDIKAVLNLSQSPLNYNRASLTHLKEALKKFRLTKE